MNESKLKILCIEDDEDTCELVSFVFSQAGYEVEACSQLDCLELLHKEKFAAIILDNHFIERSGVDICQELRSFDQTTPVIFFSGEARETEIDKAFTAGANVYLVKPNDFEKLVPMTIKLTEAYQATA